MYRFPRDLEEQKRWELCLPNKLTSSKNDDGTFKKHVVVCYKHFPPNVATKTQPGGSQVPTEAPSIFGNTQPSLIPQTTPRLSRSPEARNVTSEARTRRSEENLVDPDIVVEFADLVSYCSKFSPQQYVDTSTPGTVKTVKSWMTTSLRK